MHSTECHFSFFLHYKVALFVARLDFWCHVHVFPVFVWVDSRSGRPSERHACYVLGPLLYCP